MAAESQSLGGGPAAPPAGSELRFRFESLGTTLGDCLGAVVAGLPRRAGPKAVAGSLGITTVTAHRLLKALAQSDPIATLQLLPGPKPLRKIVAAAGEKGVGPEVCDAALAAIESFDELIRTEAGDRSSLKAMLSTWLPEERREFEAQRRQSIFKAMAELEGVSSELELNCIVLHPGAQDSKVDVVDIKALLGIDRIRPDAVVQLGTQRLATPGRDVSAGRAASEQPRIPTNLEGEPALDGMHTVRLDEFCAATPAPLAARRFGPFVQYSLAPTGFGPASKVDLVLVEVNRDEPVGREPNSERPPYFFAIPEMPVRRMIFDLVVHRDLYPDSGPELLAYGTAGRGAAVAGDPARELDLRSVPETIDVLGTGLMRMRLLEFPRYGELQRRVLDKLGWHEEEFRCYRLAINYPLVGTQITFAFLQPGSPTS